MDKIILILKNPYFRFIGICAICIGTAWTVANEILVNPRDFTITQQEKTINRLEKKLGKVERELAHLQRSTIRPSIVRKPFVKYNNMKFNTYIVDSFDKETKSGESKYPGYIGTQLGYDIYYDDADVKLSYVDVNSSETTDKALHIKFNLPPIFSWGNWLTIRKEFNSPRNLSVYGGLSLLLKVEAPSPETTLRISLSDIVDGQEQEDENWWFDCEISLLKRKTQGWIEVLIPFDSFYISYGAGTRHNDYKKNLREIIAYEINLISKSEKKQNGIILLNRLRGIK